VNYRKTNAYPNLQRDLQFFPLGVEEPVVLTSDQINSYNKDGFLYPIKIFNQPEVIFIREYFDDLLDKALSSGWNSYEIMNWHKHCKGIYEILTDYRILDVVQDLLGESVILRHSHFFVKLPGDGKQISWHQDSSYWPLSKSRVVSVWLAIDDSDIENGAMKVIPGSHLKNQLPFIDSKEEENNVLSQTVPDAEKYGMTSTILELKSGEISLHSDWTLHGSDVNSSKRRRCGLAMRFLSNDVKAYNGWNSHSVVCRGTDPTGHWANNPRPSSENIPKKEKSNRNKTLEGMIETKEK
jgi:ectoine hydroxylase-related dioxygenase (phytanoyl-CoA dioxygenase family)|tara:strand:- start:1178 stop:2065 length:888 start_codon:yes stop_codon:yes gene_type:complete